MQLAERIFVKGNEPMAILCQKQTTLYNQTLFYLRQEHFNLDDMNVKYVNKRPVYGELDLALVRVG